MTAIHERRSKLTRRSFVGVVAASALATRGSLGPSVAAADTFSWKLLGSETEPAARWDHTLSADETTKQLILFGGRDAGGSPFGDTWLYDLVKHEWRQVEGTAPDPRFGQAVAVDRATGILVLFGGQSSDVFFNDTWTFDFAA